VVQCNLLKFSALLYFSAKLFVLKLCMSFYINEIIDKKDQNLGTTSLKFVLANQLFQTINSFGSGWKSSSRLTTRIVGIILFLHYNFPTRFRHCGTLKSGFDCGK
jgi:hypothetical protein